MKVNLAKILQAADQAGVAVPAFNTPTFENLYAAIEVAEELGLPVIVEHAQVHESITPLRYIGPAMVALAEQARVPVCVHLDHGTSEDHIKAALDLGFSSVMFDGSSLPLEENIERTRAVVALARQYDAGVEAELGVMGGGGLESTDANPDFYTDPVVAQTFVQATNITALAASFGTVHGFYASEPKLDYDRLAQLRDLTGVPIVMHGGSGLSQVEYETVIRHGVRKINYYSYAAKAAYDACARRIQEQPAGALFDQLAVVASEALKEDYRKIFEIFNLKLVK